MSERTMVPPPDYRFVVWKLPDYHWSKVHCVLPPRVVTACGKPVAFHSFRPTTAFPARICKTCYPAAHVEVQS